MGLGDWLLVGGILVWLQNSEKILFLHLNVSLGSIYFALIHARIINTVPWLVPTMLLTGDAGVWDIDTFLPLQEIHLSGLGGGGRNPQIPLPSYVS